jgi:hypothetical protein
VRTLQPWQAPQERRIEASAASWWRSCPTGNRAPCRRACPGFYLISYRNFAPDNPAKLDDRLLGRSPESRHVAVQADFIKRRITIIRSLGRPRAAG